MRWRDYGTRVEEKTPYDPAKDAPLAHNLRPDSASGTHTAPGTSTHLHNSSGVPKYLWGNDWLRRGRGRSWFAAWRAVDQEETENAKIRVRSGDEPNKADEAMSTAEVKDDVQQKSRLESSDHMSFFSTTPKESSKSTLISPSFKRDLANLDAGLLHKPANGTVNIEKEVEPEVVRAEGQPENQIKSERAQDPLYTSRKQDMTPIHEAEVETMFQRYQKKFQGLLFQPWRPYTHINLDLDPEGEYVDPDMGRYAEAQPEIATDAKEQISAVPEPRLENETIHILGLGPIGKYIAHTLASLPHAPPITLLMHRPLVMQHWHDEGAAIRLVKDGEVHVQSGFHIESAARFRRQHPDQVFRRFGQNLEHSAEAPDTVIDNLIVTTDSWTTIPALEAIKNRLRQRSTICFVQDGLGIAEKVSAEIFTDPDRRPTYVLGSISHKIASTERHFTIIEKGSGTFTCSKLPQRSVDKYSDVTVVRSNFSWSPQAKHLVASLARAPELNTKALGHKSFYKSQLQKVVLGCIIGPLSVMYNCSNDQLLYNYNAAVTMRGLLEEISKVICSLPELKTLDGVHENFNARKLEAICVSTIAKTGRLESKMLQSVRAGGRTNVDYYNGYILRRAAQLGIPCPRNEMILSIVKGKIAMNSKELNGHIPLLASH